MDPNPKHIAVATIQPTHQPPRTDPRPDAHGAAAVEIPQELPPRPAVEARRFDQRRCFTCNFFRSYSLRRLPNTRTRLRRIAMIVTLFLAFAQNVFHLFYAILWQNAGFIVLLVIDIFLLWLLAGWLAIIGDAVGTRKVLGLTLGRNFFDAYIYALTAAYAAFDATMWFAIWMWGYQGGWIGLNVLTFAVAWIASEPPSHGASRDAVPMV